jgi:hypothetical protein
MAKSKNPETIEAAVKSTGKRIELKTRAELNEEVVQAKYHQLLKEGKIINSENALESARIRFENMMRNAKTKEEIKTLERKFRKIEKNLTPRDDTPANRPRKAMVTV